MVLAAVSLDKVVIFSEVLYLRDDDNENFGKLSKDDTNVKIGSCAIVQPKPTPILTPAILNKVAVTSMECRESSENFRLLRQ